MGKIESNQNGLNIQRLHCKKIAAVYKMQWKNSIAFEEMPLTLKRILKKVTTIIKPHQKPANWKCNAPRFCGYAFRKQQGKTKIGGVEKSIESWHKSLLSF